MEALNGNYKLSKIRPRGQKYLLIFLRVFFMVFKISKFVKNSYFSIYSKNTPFEKTKIRRCVTLKLRQWFEK